MAGSVQNLYPGGFAAGRIGVSPETTPSGAAPNETPGAAISPTDAGIDQKFPQTFSGDGTQPAPVKPVSTFPKFLKK